jgi:glycosyltransferase involved in cell wall biosynthesis
MTKEYPRILIVGNYFEKRSGGGITLSNLFYGWDKSKIAVVASEISDPDFSLCENIYSLGSKEIVREFPFNARVGNHEIKSGPLPVKLSTGRSFAKTSIKESKFKETQNYLLQITGQIHRRRKFVISHELLNWIEVFSPEVIYSQLSSLELIRFMQILSNRLQIPTVFHFMDDWPVAITKKQINFFKLYWKRTIDKELRILLANSSMLMSICQSMSEAFRERYSLNFIPFHNPIEIDEWLHYSKKDWKINDTFKILYTGRIGTANNNSLNFIAKAINQINQTDLTVQFDIYTPDVNSAAASKMKAYKGIYIKGTLPHSEMPSLLSGYDLLLLPLDFDKQGISFAQYSMPTKASEYMISGTPVLVFASMKTALAQYATTDKWAFVVTQHESATLISEIKRIIGDESARSFTAKRAIQVAINNENAESVRENFRQGMISAITNKVMNPQFIHSIQINTFNQN